MINSTTSMSNVSLSYLQLISGYIIYYYTPYICSTLVFLLQFIDIRYYVIYAEKEKFREIAKKLEDTTYFSGFKYNNGRLSSGGYFIGMACCGYLDTLDRYEDSERIHIMTTSNYYKKITKEKEVEGIFRNDIAMPQPDNSRSTSKIRVYNRNGTYKRFYYDHINLNLGSINPLGQQGEIIDNISDIYDKNKRATIFIHGVSYAGKSSIGYLLAKKYNGRFCHSFNPTDAGDYITYIINIMNSDNDNDVPIIIVLEESDIIINDIHSGSVKINKEVPTSVYNKSTWSTFLDDMIFYKNVILILTSNKSKEEIDKLDSAYLRKGRIHASYSMNTPLQIDF